jgi:hypothetical protein
MPKHAWQKPQIQRQSFQDTQLEFAAHLRHPQLNKAPDNIENRRLAIYRNLFFNNIEGFLASGFPILKSIIQPQNWRQLVRDFIYRHQSHSPYFLDISEEFLGYLQHERQPEQGDPVFMLELAHYEWVELALDISPIEMPENLAFHGDVLADYPVVSPTAWRFVYQYPVHRIGPNYQPTADRPADADSEVTALIVYRNRELQLGFMESNPLTLRLLEILEEQQLSGRAAIVKLAAEVSHPQPEVLVKFGGDILQALFDREIICGFRPIV